MIETRYLDTLRKIHARLKERQVNWVITGSLGMALQGMDMDVHDVDIQTDKMGAYEIEGCLSEYMVQPVRYSPAARIRSHLGALQIEDVRVEIMGDIQKLLKDGTWEEPVQVECHKCWVEAEGMKIPVLSLEYEYEAYLKLGRNEKAEKLREWLQEKKRAAGHEPRAGEIATTSSPGGRSG